MPTLKINLGYTSILLNLVPPPNITYPLRTVQNVDGNVLRTCDSIFGIFDYIEGDSTTWEQEPMKNLAQDNQLFAYRHEGFWHPMDTLRDKTVLEKLWNAGKAPWKVWDK